MLIGIDVGGTKLEVAALNEEGRILFRERSATPAGDYDAIVRVIADLVAKAEKTVGDEGRVGIGIPGTMSPATGLVKNAYNLALNGRPFDRDVAEVLGRPVRVVNDANCFALSEAVDGAGAGKGVVWGIILGTGCGSGIVVDGRVFSGANAIAGEWGHNPLPWPGIDELPGLDCTCGKKGCIETFISGRGLERHHERDSGETLRAPEIIARAEAGDDVAERNLARFENRLARALASVINLLDPDVIVLGGGMSNTRHLYDRMPELWGEWVFSDRVDTPLLEPRYGDSSGVRGAAWLWAQGE